MAETPVKSLQDQYAERQAAAQKTYDQRTADTKAAYNERLANATNTYNERQAAAQKQYDQRQAEAQNQYNARLAESEGRIGSMYDNALASQKQALQTALDRGTAAQEEARANIAKTFQTSANDLAVQYERNKRNLNMQALARGLNTGTASQQQLALNQGFMNSYGALRGEEGTQNAGIDRAIANLKVDYQNNIAQAIADNDYKKAATLMDNYNSRLAWLDNQQAANRNRLDNLNATNQNYLDTQNANALSYLDNMNLNNQNRLDSRSDTNQNWLDNQSLARAQTLASYGDFSGYTALGYDKKTINNMKQIWIAQNPDLAYNTGAIDAERYHAMTGQYPAGYTEPGGGGGGGWYGGSGGGPGGGDPKTQEDVIKQYKAALDSGNSQKAAQILSTARGDGIVSGADVYTISTSMNTNSGTPTHSNSLRPVVPSTSVKGGTLR